MIRRIRALIARWTPQDNAPVPVPAPLSEGRCDAVEPGPTPATREQIAESIRLAHLEQVAARVFGPDPHRTHPLTAGDVVAITRNDGTVGICEIVRVWWVPAGLSDISMVAVTGSWNGHHAEWHLSARRCELLHGDQR